MKRIRLGGLGLVGGDVRVRAAFHFRDSISSRRLQLRHAVGLHRGCIDAQDECQ